MAASGRPVEVTFTPQVAGRLLVTCAFSSDGSGSDWGAGRVASVFMEQAGVTTYDGEAKLPTARAPFTITGAFDVAAGQEVKCGLYGSITGASSVNFYDIYVVAEHIKH